MCQNVVNVLIFGKNVKNVKCVKIVKSVKYVKIYKYIANIII